MGLLSELARLDFNLVQAARLRLEAGEINQVESNSAEIRYGQTHRALVAGRENYRLQRSSLGRLLGGKAGAEPEPEGPIKLQPIQVEIEGPAGQCAPRRPDLRARQLEIARLDTETALNQLSSTKPQSGGPGSFMGHENNTERFIGPMLGFSMPLFNRRTGEATILAGRRAQAKDKMRAGELDVEQQVRDAYNRYVTARQALAIYEREVVVPARQSFGLLEAAFTEGKIDLLRLSIAEREAFEARMAYVDTWFNVRAAQVAIEIATRTPMVAGSR